MRAWFEALEARERALVLLAGAVVLGAVLYLAVWEPLTARVSMLEDRIQRDQMLVTWLHQVGPRVEALRAGARKTVIQGRDRTLLAIVDQTSRAAALDDAVDRIQPDGDAVVRVWLDDAGFDATVRWLFELSRNYGIRVESARFDTPAREGRVSARLSLRRDPA